MGALGAENTRRGEFVSKRAVFEGIAADPALDGGLLACCVSGGSGSANGGGATASGHGTGNSDSSVDPGSGGCGGVKGRSGGAPADLDLRGSKSRHRSGTGQAAPVAGSYVDATATDNGADSGGNKRAAALEAPGVTDSKSNRRSGDKAASKNERRRKQRQELLASSSTCATAGGTTAPASLLPARGSLTAGASAHYLAGTAAHANTDDWSLGSSNDQYGRLSSLFVWPGKLDGASGAPGLEVRVPHRLTCVRATAFEARFKGAHNALLAGTRGGLALAFDWGCLLRDSGSGGGGGGTVGGDSDRVGSKGGGKGSGVLAPSAQVMCYARQGACVFVCVCVCVLLVVGGVSDELKCASIGCQTATELFRVCGCVDRMSLAPACALCCDVVFEIGTQ